MKLLWQISLPLKKNQTVSWVEFTKTSGSVQVLAKVIFHWLNSLPADSSEHPARGGIVPGRKTGARQELSCVTVLSCCIAECLESICEISAYSWSLVCASALPVLACVFHYVTGCCWEVVYFCSTACVCMWCVCLCVCLSTLKLPLHPVNNRHPWAWFLHTISDFSLLWDVHH